VLTTLVPDLRATYPFLAWISPATRERLERDARPLRGEAGIFRQEGDACETVTLLRAGYVRIVKRRPTGREITLYTVSPGQVCVLEVLAVLVGTPYRAEAIIEEPVAGVAIPAAAFRDAAGEPSLRGFLDRELEARLATALELVGDVALGTLEARLARLLLQRASDDGDIRATHEHLARELACAREAVSRALGGWERAGIVRLGRGRLRVLDPTRLAGLAGPGAESGSPAARP
jgi:CRP/FNR family transcriptional regulator, anaerobic regulatory protein